MADKTQTLTARLKLVTSDFNKHINEATKKIKIVDRSFKEVSDRAGAIGRKLAIPFSALSGIGAISIKGVVSQFVTLGDSIDKAAIRAGVTTGALQRLRAAAQLSGMSTEQMDKALSKLTYQMGQASAGNNDNLVTMFKSLGVQWKDSTGKAKDAASVMRELADAVKVNTDPTKRLQMLTGIFGDKLAAYLVPALQDGAEGLDAMAKQADELGLVMSNKDVKTAAALGDKMELFKGVLVGISSTVGARLSPTLMKLIDKLQALVLANKEIITAKISEAIESIARAVDKINFEEVISQISSFIRYAVKGIEAVGGLSTIVKVFAGIMAARGVIAVAKMTSAVVSFGVALYGVVGIPGLVVAAIAGAAYLIYKHFDKIKAVATKVWAGISGFLKERWGIDFNAAFKGLSDRFGSLFKSLGIDFSSFSSFFTSSWDAICRYVSNLWKDSGGNIFKFIASYLKDVVKVIMGAWKALFGFFGDLLAEPIAKAKAAYLSFEDFCINLVKKIGEKFASLFTGIADMWRNAFTKAASWLPDWMTGGNSAGVNVNVANPAVMSMASPTFPNATPQGMKGEVTVTVRAADGATASVDEIRGRGGDLVVNSGGSYDF